MSDDPLPQQPEPPPQHADLLPPSWWERVPISASSWATLFLWGLAGVAVALFVASLTGFVYDSEREWNSQVPLLCAYAVFLIGLIAMIAGVLGWCIARWRRY
jgi:hypothetical protein